MVIADTRQPIGFGRSLSPSVAAARRAAEALTSASAERLSASDRSRAAASLASAAVARSRAASMAPRLRSNNGIVAETPITSPLSPDTLIAAKPGA